MSDKRDDDAFLGAYFDDMRAEAPVPGPVLLAAIAADAAREQPRAAPPSQAPGRTRAVTWWRALPGRLALAGGLTAATLAGVWIGYNPPASLDFLDAALVGGDAGLNAQMTLAFDSLYQFEG